MTNKEAMQMALDALEDYEPNAAHKAIETLRARLAEHEKEQEPVAWLYPEGLEALKAGKCWTAYGTKQDDDCRFPVYTAPPQREWQGLTDEEQGQVAWSCGSMSADWMEFARAIEAKLKEKNT